VVVTLIVNRVTGSVVPTYDRAVWIELQSAALPLGFFLITLTLYTYIDTVILGIMRTDAETGWYAASYRVYEGLMYAPSAFATVLTPRFSQLFVDDPRRLRTLFQRSLLGSAAAAVLVGGVAVLLARPMMLLFYGPAYEAAVPPLQVLAGGSIFVFCTWILHSAAIAINLDRRLVATTAIGLCTNIALNIAFIPSRGITGAAWATVIAEALTVTLLFAQVQRRLRAAGPRA
jgi:O-antigen/teichoic acid export membrane protein